MSGWGGDFDDGLPIIKADKIEQHIHTFPDDDALISRGFRTGFGVALGVGFAIGIGKLIGAALLLVGRMFA